MHQGDKEKIPFRTGFDNFYYEVMPFGLKNAGATYQRLMDYIFHDMIGRSVEVYVDDIVAIECVSILTNVRSKWKEGSS